MNRLVAQGGADTVRVLNGQATHMEADNRTSLSNEIFSYYFLDLVNIFMSKMDGQKRWIIASCIINL